MPASTEYFRFFITDSVTSKRRRTRFAMSREEAAERYGTDAVADENTRELRTVYALGEEPPANTKAPIEARAVDESRLSSCGFCEGSGWMCADHPTQPFEHDGCGAEGSPCVCNPEGAVQWQHVYAEVPSDKPRH